MLKSLTVIFLLGAFMAQSFEKAVIVIDYFSRTSVYKKNCENKKRPQMQCNGKCQMMKKLQAEEKKDQANPERKLENKQQVLACNAVLKPNFLSVFLTTTYFTDPRTAKATDASFALLRPPATIV